MGRRAKPAALKEAQGNPGKRRIPAEAAAAEHEAPARIATPNWLTKEAGEFWRRLAPDLARMKFLRDTDILAFGRYCEWMVKWLKVERKLRRAALVKTTKSAHVQMERINKHLQVQLMIEKRLESLEDRFGLNPRARYQVMQQLANRPPELPLGQSQEQQSDDQPAAASSPIGCLNTTKSVH